MDEYEASRIATRLALGWADDDFDLLAKPVRGTSGALVSFFRNHKNAAQQCTVKCVQGARISLVEEASRREKLLVFLAPHIPKILWTGRIDAFEVMICECPATSTLQSKLEETVSPALHRIWQDFIHSLLTMWLDSREAYRSDLTTRPFDRRIQRIRSGLSGCSVNGLRLDELLEMPVVVNGEHLPSLRAAFDAIAAVPPPEFGITCHGDPQPSNILVSNDEWYLIDWEWSGPHHDWRMMLSHLHGWWATRFLVNDLRPNMFLRDGALNLTYQVHLNPEISAFQEDAKLAFRLLTPLVADDDLKAVNCYLAALYFGELRFLHGTTREDLAIPLIGEAARLAYAIASAENGLIDEEFGMVL